MSARLGGLTGPDLSSQQSKTTITSAAVLDQQARRRERGLLACAECHRLKMRCDKKVPCTACVSKGCADICPNGIRTITRLPPGLQVFIDGLQQKISTLTQRVRELEHALHSLQSNVSQQPHPLLHERQPSEEVNEVKIPIKVENDDDVAYALGSLTIDSRGEKYFGLTGSIENWLLRMNASDEQDNTSEAKQSPPNPMPVSPHIADLSNLFPFLPGGAWHDDYPMYAIVNQLPDWNRASQLFQLFFRNVFYGPRIVFKNDIMESVMLPIYTYIQRSGSDPSARLSVTPHQISTLLAMFALAAVTETAVSERNVEAEDYYHLARAAFQLHDISDSPGIPTVQSLVLCSSYHLAAPAAHGYSTDSAWALIQMACGVAHRMGLHRDPDRLKWGFDPVTIQWRRTLFWELFMGDSYLALLTGRPPSLSCTYIDCELPSDNEGIIDDKEEVNPGQSLKRYRLARDITYKVVELTGRVTQTPYESILKLDEEILGFMVPDTTPSAKDASNASPLKQETQFVLDTHVQNSCHLMRLYLHRNFCAVALTERPDDPDKSHYGRSFMACSDAAFQLVALAKHKMQIVPDSTERWMDSFVHAFAAALILGAIGICAPSHHYAEPALLEVKSLIEMASKHVSNTRNGRKGIAVLTMLWDKAMQVFLTHRANPEQSRDMNVTTVALLDIYRDHPTLRIVMDVERPGPKPNHIPGWKFPSPQPDSPETRSGAAAPVSNIAAATEAASPSTAGGALGEHQRQHSPQAHHYQHHQYRQQQQQQQQQQHDQHQYPATSSQVIHLPQQPPMGVAGPSSSPLSYPTTPNEQQQRQLYQSADVVGAPRPPAAFDPRHTAASVSWSQADSPEHHPSLSEAQPLTATSIAAGAHPHHHPHPHHSHSHSHPQSQSHPHTPPGNVPHAGIPTAVDQQQGYGAMPSHVEGLNFVNNQWMMFMQYSGIWDSNPTAPHPHHAHASGGAPLPPLPPAGLPLDHDPRIRRGQQFS